jgi:hypothetical protein
MAYWRGVIDLRSTPENCDDEAHVLRPTRSVSSLPPPFSMSGLHGVSELMIGSCPMEKGVEPPVMRWWKAPTLGGKARKAADDVRAGSLLGEPGSEH